MNLSMRTRSGRRALAPRAAVTAAVCLMVAVGVVTGLMAGAMAPAALAAPVALEAAPAPVPGWAAEALAADAGDRAAVAVAEDHVAWSEPGPQGDLDVYLLDVASGAVVNLASEPGDDIEPAVEGGHVVWQWHDGHDWEILLRDLASGETKRLTDNDWDDRHPSISGRWVVFIADVPQASAEVFLYGIESGALTRLTTNIVEDTAPRIQDGRPWSDGLLAWQRWDGDDWEIYYWKLGAPAPVQLTKNSYDDVAPSVGAGWIVWEGLAEGTREIFASNPYDPRGSRQITKDAVDDWAPRVEAGRLVWLKAREGGTGDPATDPTDLYTFDLRFLTGAQLTDDETRQDVPDLDLWRVVWSEAGGVVAGAAGGAAEAAGGGTAAGGAAAVGVDSRVMMQSLVGGVAGTLSTGFSGSMDPRVSGSLVAWLYMDGVGGDAADGGAGGDGLGLALARAAFPFADVPLDHAYREAVQSLMVMGAVNGRTEDTFEPDSLLNRQQFAKMAVLTVGIPVSEADVCTFKDVKKTGPETLFPDNYVATAHKRGLVLGTSATTFAPYESVTRAQVITIVVRAADKFASGGLVWLPSGWQGVTEWYANPTHGDNVHLAEVNHLLDGIDLEGWDPDAACTRGEAAQIVWNLWLRLAAPGALVAER